MTVKPLRGHELNKDLIRVFRVHPRTIKSRTI